jgi:hypothetical protein
MPIGKNALKRVSSSHTSAQAPLKESAIAAEEKVKIITETLTPPTVEEAPVVTPAAPKKTAPKKTTQKKAAPKAAPQKSMEKEPDLSPVKTAEKIATEPLIVSQKQEIKRFSLGEDLPYYLL